ncbi:RNA polymerase II mediator complex middle subunit MED9 [Aspergillus candidus]|uniref:Mediator of RNA polymerase II transcription subunit 9 n=1 Tax=Aspergillus candidus TaxID=41067 RepID=A0A2I2FJL6_ASPCN|nr:RNA polymerase II transcription mediator complex subunit 9-domain-containing protein [Aspergillus candidus]PLB40828.1 RNA polymerase II transcription mediator complex subunit 9-domain-containing protein [Aspergillus candidus]
MASRSPTAMTPLPKSVPGTPGLGKETTINTPIPQPPQQPVDFPPPQTFDIIPPLHGLLLRLLSPHANADGPSNGTRAGEDTTGATGAAGLSSAAGPSQTPSQQAQGQSQQQSSTGNGSNGGLLPGPSSAVPGSASAAAEIAALASNAPPPLDLKDLPTEASSIKIRIQKAYGVVDSLPDVQRSVSEQTAEIAELEDRISRLKSVISDFGRRADLGN